MGMLYTGQYVNLSQQAAGGEGNTPFQAAI